MSDTGLIIQARTGSSRLPQKMLMPFFKGKPLLRVVLERIKDGVPVGTKIVVATTTVQNDDVIAHLAKEMGLEVFRGSENNVLDRFIGAAEKFGIERIIRVCADNPFLDMPAMNVLMDRFRNSKADYLAYVTSDGIPTIKTHYGFWAEGVLKDALTQVVAMTDEKLYHEHVTNYIYTEPDGFDIEFMPIPERADRNRRIRMTIDTEEDFDNMSRIYADMVSSGQDINIDNVITYLDSHPEYYEAMELEIKLNAK